MTPHQRIRPATIDDLPEILRLVHELAAYEREPDAVEATQSDLARVLFGVDAAGAVPAGASPGAPTAFCHVAELDPGDGPRVVGIAVWFLSFSTWTGRNGIWLEDLFVEPAHRGRGLGRALLAALAQICAEHGYRRLEWWVLDWNAPSIGFYRSLGAIAQDEWTTYRLQGDALAQLAQVTPAPG